MSSPSDNPSVPPATGYLERELTGRLIDAGVPRSQARRIARCQDPNVIERQLTWLPQRTCADPVSYLLAAIAHDYEAPGTRPGRKGRSERNVTQTPSTEDICPACFHRMSKCLCADPSSITDVRMRAMVLENAPRKSAPAVPVQEKISQPAPAPRPAPAEKEKDLVFGENDRFVITGVREGSEGGPTFTQMPNIYYDFVAPELGLSERVVMDYLLRYLYDPRRRESHFSGSLREMCEGTVRGGRLVNKGVGIARSSLVLALEKLERKGLITLTTQRDMKGGLAASRIDIHVPETPGAFERWEREFLLGAAIEEGAF